MFSRRQLGGKWWAGGTHVPLNMSIYIQNKRHIDPQIHAEIWSSDLCFGLGQGGACSFRLDSLYLLSLRLSWASQISHMALSMIWFQSIWEKSLLRKRSVGGGGNRENTTWVKHQWEWWGDGESHGVGGGGVGWWNAVAVSTFEEPVENVGTTSKEHHEIYNTPPPLLLLPLLWLQTLVPSGVVFLNWLFSAHVHRSSCETQAAGIQMAVFSSFHLRIS